MSSYVFQTPANIKDFQQPSSYQKWSEWISASNDYNIASVQATFRGLFSQYYNPADNPKVTNTGDAVSMFSVLLLILLLLF